QGFCTYQLAQERCPGKRNSIILNSIILPEFPVPESGVIASRLKSSLSMTLAGREDATLCPQARRRFGEALQRPLLNWGIPYSGLDKPTLQGRFAGRYRRPAALPRRSWLTARREVATGEPSDSKSLPAGCDLGRNSRGLTSGSGDLQRGNATPGVSPGQGRHNWPFGQ